MTSIGESLRRERLRRNLQLEQVSSELKISSRMLAAIEAEDFQKLPGGVFTKSFVRQYAHLLGLDEEEMAAEVDRMLRPEPPSENPPKSSVDAVPLPRMEAWQSVSDSRPWLSGWSSSLPALMLVVVVMLVCSGVYAFLQRPRQEAAQRHPAPLHTQSAPQQAAATPPAPAAEQPAAPVPAQEQASQPPATVAAEPAPQRPAETAAAAPAPTAAPTAPGPVHVEVTAVEPVWIRVVSDGKYVFSGTLAAHETRTIDGTENVMLRLGDAGGVNILLNGKPIGEIGPKGQVRNVQLTSGGFQIVPAVKSPAPLDPL